MARSAAITYTLSISRAGSGHCLWTYSPDICPPGQFPSLFKWHRTFLPWQVHERGTVYCQLSAQPHRLLPLKKNLNHFCLDCHSVCDNVYCLLTMFSALTAVCTVYCAIEIVLITLHYITFCPFLHRHPPIYNIKRSTLTCTKLRAVEIC